MQIWLDLRFLKNNLYSNFIIELVKNLVITNTNNQYIIYINSNSYNEKIILWLEKTQNCKIKKIEIENLSIKEQIHFLKILKNDKNNLMIFFNHFKPIFYRWFYYTFVLNLKDIYYWNFDSSFSKYKYLYLLEKNLQKSQKIICLDESTKNELIERFNINENLIYFIDWFFADTNLNHIKKDIEINIKTKHSIKNDYLIYSCWDWIEKNIEKLVQIFDKIENNIELIILWETISKNIFLRNKIINLWLQDRIKFISPIKDSEKPLIYKQSIWVIFPSLYETFPFCLADTINLNTPIIASNLKNIQNVFWEKIKYFSPISKSDMIKNINDFVKSKQQKVDYSEIINKYWVENTTKQLIKIIN